MAEYTGQTVDEATGEISGDALLSRVSSFVKSYMSRYDVSHDWTHICRVHATALHILRVESQPQAESHVSALTANQTRSGPDSNSNSGPQPSYDPLLISLSALLHDVDDHKYAPSPPWPSASSTIRTTLQTLGAAPALAETVALICANVSYTHESSAPGEVARVLGQHPELAIVQDADRLDAVGAVGIGRVFAYGGAVSARGSGEGEGGRTLAGSVAHFDAKLLRIEGGMKTAEGRRLARERTRRLLEFRRWWREECREEVDELDQG